jgi:hypothetical protein
MERPVLAKDAKSAKELSMGDAAGRRQSKEGAA